MEKPPLLIALHGASGRMGKAIDSLCGDHIDFRFDYKIAYRYSSAQPCIHEENNVDIIIDFSSDKAVYELAKFCVGKSTPLLVGTTALHEDTKTVLETCAKTAPVMIAANTSFGHIVLKQMAKIAAELLDETFDIDIIDTHHRHKKDAPSGTAVNLKAALAPIAKSPIHMHAIRAGEVIGKHTISFHGKYEAIELTHTASSRYLFASGALSLAKWLLNKKPGLYSQDDIIRKNL